jgi:hypothetical protein
VNVEDYLEAAATAPEPCVEHGAVEAQKRSIAVEVQNENAHETLAPRVFLLAAGSHAAEHSEERSR